MQESESYPFRFEEWWSTAVGFGPWGGLVFLLFLLWWQWPNLKKRPAVGAISDRARRFSVQPANPTQFTVVVGALENDRDNSYQRLLAEDLLPLSSIEVHCVDWSISPHGTIPKEAIATGHATARDYLNSSGAAVFIWGEVLAHRPPRLYFTASDRNASHWISTDFKSETFAVPNLVGGALADVLRLLIVATGESLADSRDRKYRTLDPFVRKVRTLLQDDQITRTWSSDALANVQRLYANMLQTVGEQMSGSDYLQEAADMYRHALSEFTRERTPAEWAQIQSDLGRTLFAIGCRGSTRQEFENAADAFRNALEVLTPYGAVIAPNPTQPPDSRI